MQSREAQVVADRQPQSPPRQLGNDRVGTRLVVDAFAVDLALAEIDVEHVDLVVARADVSIRREKIGAVRETPLSDLHRHRADVQPDFLIRRSLRKRRESCVARFRFRLGH